MLVLQVPPVRPALQVVTEQTEQMAQPAQLVLQEQTEQMEQMAPQALLVLPEHKVFRVYKELPGLPVQRVLQVLLVRPV